METFQRVLERAMFNYGIENILCMASPHFSTWAKSCFWINEVKIRQSKVLHRSGNKSDRFLETWLHKHDTEIGQRDRDALSLPVLKSGRGCSMDGSERPSLRNCQESCWRR